jgi:membrane-associated phospholipid phosphatase
VYAALPFFLMACVATLKGLPRKRLLLAIVIGGVICPFFYFLFPAVGPAHVGDPRAPRNCMPSMHCAWTLLLCVNSRGIGKWVFGVVAFMTAWATLATGEHYSLDLVGAVLWVWLLVAIANKAVPTTRQIPAIPSVAIRVLRPAENLPL